MPNPASIKRRTLLTGLAATASLVALPHAGAAELDPNSDADQSQALQAALHAATATGRLSLPPGRFRVSGLRIPGNLIVEGVPGATWLVSQGNSIGAISVQKNVVLRDIGFAGDSGDAPLFGIELSDAVALERCLFRDNAGIGLVISQSAVTIRDCDFAGHGDAAIHSVDSKGLLITASAIANCGNAGIRIWRSESGKDGSIVTQNRISSIAFRDGGNGQNGNGINVYLADDVIVADNHISDCAFTAVRLNTTRDTQVTGNQCLNSGEVAIFSEFAFSGSIIANNLVDGAATGISITNLDSGGRLAVCMGNIVRNITPKSAVNPDTIPIGIYAEAETAITGNAVDNVPGAGIAAGWGPYLRNVTISGNVVSDSRIGIAVSVVEGVGPVTVSGNRVEATEQAIAGMRWTDVAEPDLEAAAGKYPNLTIS